MARRFVVAMMEHETNTFSPMPTGLEAFGRGDKKGPPTGDAAIAAFKGTNMGIAAFIDLAEAEKAELVVPIAANAHPSGLVTREAYEHMAGAICDAVRAGCDAVLLDLHGAMVAEHTDDGEGELLARIRKIAPGIPIAVSLDFHANLTRRIVENATVVTGYCTYPHIDMYETGRRAGATLKRALAGEVVPVMVWGSLPILSHTLAHAPQFEPMKSIMARAQAAEASGQVLNASVFGGFALADIPHVGLGAIIVGDRDPAAAQALLDSLFAEAWEKREGLLFNGAPMDAALKRAQTLDGGREAGGPIILVDHADNTASGGTQDVMLLLDEVIKRGFEDVAAGPICDPEAVAKLVEAGVGATVTLKVGGRTDMPTIQKKGEPLELTGRVRCITDGRWKVTGPMMTGVTVNIGRTVVLDTGKVQILISEQRTEPFDLGVFTHCGIDPTAKKYLLIKSRQHFRAGFEPIAKHIVLVDGVGVTASDYALFPFDKVRRPIYPLDPDTPMDAGRNMQKGQ
ncbi:MAG: M81 family metallopeptidase [Dongiaceae bacterium]